MGSFIDSYFAEKYLGFPSKHLQEYDNADLTMKATNLNDRHFLLIHGTADTKVTSEHSFVLAKALVEQEILFQQLVSGTKCSLQLKLATDYFLHDHKFRRSRHKAINIPKISSTFYKT